MRITRNYRNGLMNAKQSNESSRLFRNALGRSQSSRRSSILNGTNRTNSAVNRNFGTTARNEKFYPDMKYHAKQVAEYAGTLTSQKNSIFDKAKESGSTAEIQSNIKGFVKQYNNMVKDLKESGSKTDRTLRTQLEGIAGSYRQELASTGVTKNADGTLVIDEKKLAAADLETLQKVWGSADGFVDKAAKRADAVAATAEQNMKAQSSSNYANPFDRSNLYGNYGSRGNYFNFFR